MERDYTASMLASLETQISKINNTTLSPLSDAVGDILIKCSAALGLIKSDNFLGGVKSYHKWVLDSHNTAIKDLEAIFQAVYEEDAHYSRIIENINKSTAEYAEQLKQLTSILDPRDITSFNPESVKKLGEKIDKDIQGTLNRINKTYDELLDIKETQMLYDGLKSTVLGILKMTTTVLSFMKDCSSGNSVKALLDMYDIVDIGMNDICFNSVSLLTGYTLFAKGGSGIARLLGKDDLARSFEKVGIETGTERSGYDSMAEAIIADHKKGDTKYDKAVVSAFTFVKNTKEAADVATSFIDFTDGILDFEDGEKSIGEVVVNMLGFSKTKGIDSDLDTIKAANKYHTVAKNVKRIVDLGIAGGETYDWFGMGDGDNKLVKEGIKPMKFFGFIKDVNTFSEDVFNWPLLGN